MKRPFVLFFLIFSSCFSCASRHYTAPEHCRLTDASRGAGVNCGASVTVYVFPPKESKKEGSAGSGVIVSEDGFILTAAHVIGDSLGFPTWIVYQTSDGKFQRIAATPVKIDYRSDLALLSVPMSFSAAARLGSSQDLQPGSPIYAITNFYGEDPGALTRGKFIMKVPDSKIIGLNVLKMRIRLVPGSSGGGIFDEQGRLVGIARSIWTWKWKWNLPISFAAPAETIRAFLGKPLCGVIND